MARQPRQPGAGEGNGGFGVNGIRAGLEAIYKALSLVRGIKIVLPLLLYFLFEIGVIILYVKGGPGFLDGFWRLFLPEGAAAAIRHYPQRLLMLPVLLGRLGIAFDVLLYSIAQGTTVLLIASAISGGPISLSGCLGRTMRRYWHIAGVMLIATLALIAATYIPSIPSSLGWVEHNRYLSTGGGIILGILAQAFFLFALPFVLLRGEPLLGAIGRSFRFAGRRYLLALTLAAVPFVITIPTLLLGFKAQIISLRTFPELMMHIHILGEIMKLVSGYILIGGVTVALIEESPPASEPEGGKTPSTEEGAR